MSIRGPNLLLVEGGDDEHAIRALIGKYVDWTDRDNPPVQIESRGGAENILDRHTIPLRLKSTTVKTLGVVVDADTDFHGRWQRLSQIVAEFFPSIASEIPPEGLIIGGDGSKRLGIWVMPDNGSRGMLETFLQELVPTNGVAILEHAEQAISKARELGAPCGESHLDKAKIHTWLAWQSPPGNRFATAIVANMLDSSSQLATRFVTWFLELYELSPEDQTDASHATTPTP